MKTITMWQCLSREKAQERQNVCSMRNKTMIDKVSTTQGRKHKLGDNWLTFFEVQEPWACGCGT